MRYGATWLPQGLKKAIAQYAELILLVIVAISIVGGICRFFGEYLIRADGGTDRGGIATKDVSAGSESADLALRDARNRRHGQPIRCRTASMSIAGLNFIFAKSLRDPLRRSSHFSWRWPSIGGSR